MINWILGAIIAGVTVFGCYRTIGRIKKGKGCCGGGCSQSECNCSK